MIPKDPVMLLSFANMKLRDFYSSLDAMCEDLQLDRKDLEKKLGAIDYAYDEKLNRFILHKKPVCQDVNPVAYGLFTIFMSCQDMYM